MVTLPELVSTLWGRKRAWPVAQEYRHALVGRDLLMRDLAMFCNAAGHIEGPTEFERGVEEGKRRVWLHIARMMELKPEDFPPIADGRNLE